MLASPATGQPVCVGSSQEPVTKPSEPQRCDQLSHSFTVVLCCVWFRSMKGHLCVSQHKFPKRSTHTTKREQKEEKKEQSEGAWLNVCCVVDGVHWLCL